MFGKCPFLLRWKNVLSSSHALHLRFIRNKSVTRTVISVNRPFIFRYTSHRAQSLPRKRGRNTGIVVVSRRIAVDSPPFWWKII